ncbi:MAG: hypothetical protein ABW123_18700, partial [Cystobacter sp.]
MRHQILTALLALPLVACGVEDSGTKQTENTLTLQADALTACSTPLANGATVTGISIEPKGWSCTYTLEVPASAGKLSFDLAQASGSQGMSYMHV